MKFKQHLENKKLEEEILNEFSVDKLKKTIKKASGSQLEKIKTMLKDLVSGGMISSDDATSLRSLISTRAAT